MSSPTSPFGGSVPIRYDTVTTPVEKGGFVFASQATDAVVRSFATVTGALRPSSKTEEIPAGVMPGITYNAGTTELGDVTLSVPEQAFAARNVGAFKWLAEAQEKYGLLFWAVVFGFLFVGAKVVSKLVSR